MKKISTEYVMAHLCQAIFNETEELVYISIYILVSILLTTSKVLKIQVISIVIHKWPSEATFDNKIPEVSKNNSEKG